MTTTRRPKAFTTAELTRLLAAAADRPDLHAAIRFLHQTGLRSAEALSITSEAARAWPTPTRWPRRSRPVAMRIVGKGSKERVVLLTPGAIRAARDLLPYSNGALLPWTDRGLRWLMAELGKRAGVEHVHPHRLRHSYAQEHVEAGTPPHVLADMLGHSTINTTRLYFEASVAMRIAAEKRRRKHGRVIV